MQTDYDVVVVGGGPAGSAAARRAAQKGARVALLDAASFPRSKPCGGALSEQALSYLDFGVDAALVHTDVFGARVHFGGKAVEARKPFRIAVLTSRFELDNYLLQRAAEAGATILEQTRVTRVEQDADSVAVHTSSGALTCRYVIGADGAQSVVAKNVRTRFPRNEYAVTFEFDVPCRSEDPRILACGLIDIYFGRQYMGYSWVFPKREHWNVGAGALASHADNIKVTAQSFFAGLSNLVHERERPTNAVGWIVPAGGYRRPVTQGRVLLAGDAAGFVDPFYGEGIAYAILSGSQAGLLASMACVERTKSSPEQVCRDYTSFCRREINANLSYGLMFAKVLHMWPGGLLHLFSTDPDLLDMYLDVPAARMTYKQYFSRFVPKACLGLCKMMLQR